MVCLQTLSDGRSRRRRELHLTPCGTRTTLCSREFVYSFFFSLYSCFNPQILLPEMALLRLSVLDDDHALVGQRTLPMNHLRCGS